MADVSESRDSAKIQNYLTIEYIIKSAKSTDIVLAPPSPPPFLKGISKFYMPLPHNGENLHKL